MENVQFTKKALEFGREPSRVEHILDLWGGTRRTADSFQVVKHHSELSSLVSMLAIMRRQVSQITNVIHKNLKYRLKRGEHKLSLSVN